jgi:hypothetical protein
VQIDVNFFEVTVFTPVPPFISSFSSLLTGFDDWAHVRKFLNTPAYVTGRLTRGNVIP